MPASVVDASALAAVVFGEPAGKGVVARIGDGPMLAPTLLRYEIASVCLKKIRRHPERREDLLAALALLGRMDLEEVEVPAVESTELAESADLTAYDAAYLWLARATGARLVTLDERLKAAARGRSG